MTVDKRIQINEPVFLRNLRIYPIRGSTVDHIKIADINTVLSQNAGEFRELDPPDINRIALHNRSDDPVLMLDGEEIIGSLQNRIAADSILVPAHATGNIPVVCAEEGRWDHVGTFQTGYCSYPGIRAILSRHGRAENGLQKRVWKEIERKLTATKTLSTTSSMHDIYNNLEEEVARYVEDFQSLNHDTVGFIGTAGGKILGCEIFNQPRTYRMFEQKLIRSYALDAIEHRKADPLALEPEEFLNAVDEALAAKKFSNRTLHFSIRGPNCSGQGIYFNNRIIHLSVFPN